MENIKSKINMQKKYEYKDVDGILWFIEKKIEQKNNIKIILGGGSSIKSSKGKITIYEAIKSDNTDKLTASRKSVLKQMLFEKVGVFEKQKNQCRLSFDLPFSIVELRRKFRLNFKLDENSRVSKKQIEEYFSMKFKNLMINEDLSNNTGQNGEKKS